MKGDKTGHLTHCNTKKTHKSKKNKDVSSNEKINSVHDEEATDPYRAYSIPGKDVGGSRGVKRKANKVHKTKKNKHVLSVEESNPVYNDQEAKPDNADSIPAKDIDGSRGVKRKAMKARKSKKSKHISSIEESNPVHNEEEPEPDRARCISAKDDGGSRIVKCKPKKARGNKKDHVASKDRKKLEQEGATVEAYEVYQISSGDEDCSQGMKKWLKEYHECRPGVKVLQERIDEFISSYEEEEEKARKEREEKAAEGGWTVVTHRKGGKKTTDPESGVAVGAVAQAAVLENMARKKSKDVGLDFYRFQRREAQRSEIMKLQSRFEEDKKRIQYLRAARKFKPY